MRKKIEIKEVEETLGCSLRSLHAMLYYYFMERAFVEYNKDSPYKKGSQEYEKAEEQNSSAITCIQAIEIASDTRKEWLRDKSLNLLLQELEPIKDGVMWYKEWAKMSDGETPDIGFYNLDYRWDGTKLIILNPVTHEVLAEKENFL